MPGHDWYIWCITSRALSVHYHGVHANLGQVRTRSQRRLKLRSKQRQEGDRDHIMV